MRLTPIALVVLAFLRLDLATGLRTVDCPSKCKCDKRKVDCKSKGLTKLPQFPFDTVIV